MRDLQPATGPELVLASTSPWRLGMLRAAGFRVRGEGSGIDERPAQHEISDPVALARLLAERKASAVADRYPGAWVLGADQVLTDGASVWGKPADPAAHRAQLLEQRGRAHDLVTALCVVDPSGERRVEHERTTLRIRADLTEAEVDAYVATGEASGCAGGYAVEGHGVWMIESIDGDWYNVVGLPLLRVIGLLRRAGWRYGGSP